MSKKYAQHFRAEWLKDPNYEKWLRRVEGDDTKCVCKYCHCTLSAKRSDIDRHRQTLKHKKAEKPFSTERQGTIPFEKVSSDTHVTEGNVSLFIAEHYSLRVVDHFSELCKVRFADSKGCKDFKLKRTKCSAIVCNVLAPHFSSDLKDDIGDQKFSLLIDESNDITVTKLLGIAIRFYSRSKKKIVVTFLDLVELPDCDSTGICDALKRSLKNNGLELQKLTAIGTDNASVMTGVNSGVYAKLKTEVPHLILIKCVCHSLQLAVSHATAQCLPRNLDFLIKETYNWFSHSAIRQARYKEIFSLINDGQAPLKLIHLSQTRWLSVESAIVRILQQWLELKTHFGMARHGEKCYTAEILYGMFCDKENYAFLVFLKHILGEVQRVNKKFEAEVQDPTKLLSDLLHLIDSMKSKVLIPGKTLKAGELIESYLDPRPYLGYEFEKEMSECKFPHEKQIRQRCVSFVVELIKQLEQRLPDNVQVLQSMSLLSAGECLQPIKPGIIDLAKMFTESDEILTRIDFQWRNLHKILWKKNTDTSELWAEISSHTDATGENPFSDLAELALTVLTLPHSNADVERIFSHMNIVKSKLRNRLSIKSLNALLTIRYGLRRNGSCCYDYKLPKEVLQSIGTLKAYESSQSPAGCSHTTTAECRHRRRDWRLGAGRFGVKCCRKVRVVCHQGDPAMSGFKNSQLEDSLMRLDAAMGSPGGGVMRTPRRTFTSKSARGDDSVLGSREEGLGTRLSILPHTTHLSVSGLSFLDSPTGMVKDVTVPLSVVPEDTTMDMTSAALLAQDDPGVRATQVLFSEFINIMVGHPSEAQVWEELEQYEQACAQQVEFLGKLIRKAPRHHTNFTNTQRIFQQLLHERNTWRLLGSLYTERLAEDDSKDSPMEEEPTTDLKVVTNLYDSNRTIREAQIVIDWLENIAFDNFKTCYDAVEYFGGTHIAWENTLKTLRNENSGIVQPLKGSRPLVKSLDPDSCLRESRPLHDLDQEDEMRLLLNVLVCVRSGQVSLAQELCVRAGHHWRAASLEGWKLHHDPNPKDPSQRQPITGNAYRDVWKAVAWRIASDERLVVNERAIYGALCGHLPAMLLACDKWEDTLWAYTRTMVDQWVEEQLRAATTHLRSLHPLPKDYPEEKLTLKAVFEAVEQRMKIQKEQGKNLYYLLQKYLILDDMESLLQEAHVWLNDGIAPHLLRCLTHVVLFLRKIGRIPQQLEPHCIDILEACVKEAIERGDVEQVAWYTSVLPQWLQVEWYARFLHNITDDHHRHHALQLASSVGLDTHAITSAVVTNIRLSSSGRDPDSDVVSETTAEDRVKISAIDWLLYDPQQRSEALRQANALMRTFLVSRKIGATRVLFNKLPSDSVNIIIKEYEAETGKAEVPSHSENIVREYFCIRTFLDAQDSFTDWFDHYHQKRPTAPKKCSQNATFAQQVAYEQAEQQYKGEMERWKQTLNLITTTACDRLYNVLLFPDGGWLVDTNLEEQEQDPAGTSAQEGSAEGQAETAEPNRSHHLSVLRSIYIPQVASLLQNILHATEKYKECLQLADLIASEQYQLYKAFGRCELQRFLLKLQETSRELLDQNCDALGYPLH